VVVASMSRTLSLNDSELLALISQLKGRDREETIMRSCSLEERDL
jgi:hypothetical protein